MDGNTPGKTAIIHGVEWKWKDIEEEVAWCREQTWTRQEWTSSSPDTWDHDHCSICWWKLWKHDGPEHRTGYTDGYHWLCEECYEQFIAAAGKDLNRSI